MYSPTPFGNAKIPYGSTISILKHIIKRPVVLSPIYSLRARNNRANRFHPILSRWFISPCYIGSQ